MQKQFQIIECKLIKFKYFEKATKFEEILLLVLTLCNVKIKRGISSTFWPPQKTSTFVAEICTIKDWGLENNTKLNSIFF